MPDPPPVRYVCSRCGGDAVSLIEGRTNFDERYPIGHCERCTPVPKPRIQKGTGPRSGREAVWHTPTRRTIALVRADLDDPDERAHRAKVKHARGLARKLHDPKLNAKMSDAELKQASEAVLWLRRAE